MFFFSSLIYVFIFFSNVYFRVLYLSPQRVNECLPQYTDMSVCLWSKIYFWKQENKNKQTHKPTKTTNQQETVLFHSEPLNETLLKGFSAFLILQISWKKQQQQKTMFERKNLRLTFGGTGQRKFFAHYSVKKENCAQELHKQERSKQSLVGFVLILVVSLFSSVSRYF